MDHVKGLTCVLCGRSYGATEVLYTCPACGESGNLDVAYDYAVIRLRLSRETLAANRDNSIWRYGPLLPVEPASPIPPLQVGWTPL